ncbi:MAG: GNAT family N-acetyltransferase [Spirochaetales bacterium]|nr:GNAT family N-acetyltransferase [Spirochaetales bacterium]
MIDKIKINISQNKDEIEECAKIMSTSEPWLTLKRSFNDSVKYIEDKSKNCFITKIENEIAGFILINMNGAFIGYIQSIAVKESFRGRGIGSRLIKYAEDYIFQYSPNVFICVSSFNEGAKKLYLKLGYKIIGELENYFINNQSEFLLRKTISPLSDFSGPKSD